MVEVVMVTGCGKTGWCQEMATKGNPTRFFRLAADYLDVLAGECFQDVPVGKIVNAVKFNGLAGALLLHAQGVNVVSIGVFQLVEKEHRSQQVEADKQTADARPYPAADLQGDTCMDTALPLFQDGEKTDDGEGEDERMFRPDGAFVQQRPGKRSNNVDAVAPFHLNGVEHEMEQAVAAKYHEDPAALPGETGQAG